MLRCWKQWNIASRLIFHLQMKCGLYRRFFKLLWTKGWNKAKSSAIRSSGRWQKSCCIKGTRKVHSAYICSRFPKLKHISMFYTSTQCDKSGGLLTEVKNTKSAKKTESWLRLHQYSCRTKCIELYPHLTYDMNENENQSKKPPIDETADRYNAKERVSIEKNNDKIPSVKSSRFRTSNPSRFTSLCLKRVRTRYFLLCTVLFDIIICKYLPF